jgi:pimeloyl-[acyl-carrier protein] methyl ester esterase
LTRPRLLVVSGWAHPPEALRGLAALLSPHFEISLFPAHPFARDLMVEECRSADGHVSLLGWSTGGMLAIEVALSVQERIADLVLVSSTARFCRTTGYPAGVPGTRLLAMIRGMRTHPAETLCGFLQACSTPIPQDPQHIAVAAATAVAIGKTHLIEGLEYLRETDLRSQLGNLRIPTLVLHGRKDMIVSWQASEFLAREITNSSVVFDEDAGHDLPLSRPDRIAAEVLRARGERFET